MPRRLRAYFLLSVACYLFCLCLPAYYIGEQFQPQRAYAALEAGWLGPLDGHFSWYANLLFLVALLCARRASASATWALLGLLLALSFLFHRRIMVSEAPNYESIVAYGWGYAFWIAALAILTVGQWLRSADKPPAYVDGAALLAGAAVLLVYVVYYFGADGSLHALRVERERAFESACAGAGERVLRTANDVNGVFFDPDWGVRIAAGRAKEPQRKSV